MLNFLKCGEHHYEFGEHNVIHGLQMGLTTSEAQEIILDLFPKQFDALTEELHINLTLVKDEGDAIRYLPMAEICFVPETDKGMIHVRIKKRDPLKGNVIFKDTDSFYGKDTNLDNIKLELVSHLVNYYEFIEQRG